MAGANGRLVLVAAAMLGVSAATGAFAARGGAVVLPAVSLAGLHVQGNQLVNESGQAVQLTGVNRPSWEYDCLQPRWGVLHEGPADQGEVAALQSWHVNAVRVPLNESCWLGISGVAYPAAVYQQDVAAYVDLLTRSNIAVILDLVYARPDALPAGNDARQWPMPNRAHSLAFWQSVATRFRGNGRVIFEPYNEPTPDNDHAIGPAGATLAAWRCWRDGGLCPPEQNFGPYEAAGMQELIATIRAAGATNPILVTGPDWGSDVSRWAEYKPDDPLQQLIVGWHSYNDGLACKTAACWNGVLAPLLRRYPLIADEIGEFDCRHGYIDKVMAFLDRYGQGYLAHAWGPYGCTVDPALTTDWQGTPTKSYGQSFRDHLARASATAATPPTTDRVAVTLLLLGLVVAAAAWRTDESARWPWAPRLPRSPVYANDAELAPVPDAEV